MSMEGTDREALLNRVFNRRLNELRQIGNTIWLYMFITKQLRHDDKVDRCWVCHQRWCIDLWYIFLSGYQAKIDIGSCLSTLQFLAATSSLMNGIYRPSVRPSVCLSVTPFWLCSHHRIVMKFSGFITNDKSDVHSKGQGQRSNVKVREVKTQLSHFRTVTLVLIHQWLWNDAESLKQHRRGALLFFKVIRQIWRSHRTKNRRFWTELSVSGL